MAGIKHQKKLLIVDDEQINLDFLNGQLSREGFAVEKAQDGIEALERLKHFSPDLIVLDNIMPRMNGMELIKALKSDPKRKKIPIIVFSAADDEKGKHECLRLGASGYITKPVNYSVLLARIRAAMGEI
jgi:DNA-binding response OmpR family regulator